MPPSPFRNAARAFLAACLLASAAAPAPAHSRSATTAPIPTVPMLGTVVAAPDLGPGAPPALPPALGPALPVSGPAVVDLGPALAVPARAAAPERAQRPEKAGLAGLRAATGRIAALASSARGGLQDAVLAVSSALGEVFENAQASGQPADPAAAAPSGAAGTASGLAPPGLRPLESIARLKIGAYNVENLFHQVGSHVPDPDRPGLLKKVSEAKPKPDWAMAEQGKIILEEGLDVLVMEEVEDVKALEDFNRRFLGGAYRTFLIEGNDPRGIDVAFLVKKDIPFELEQRTHKDETWRDPVLGGTRTLFSRDLTSLIFRAPGKAEPLFVLFGTHYKSKRDRGGGDHESNILRAAQVERTAEILGRYREEFGAEVPLMLGGDFNGTVPQEPAFAPLFTKAGLTDAFDATPDPPTERERITHTYHPRGGPTHYAQMDALLVSKSLRGVVKNAFVYRYKNPDGTVKPIPDTYEEREKNPSDHFPIVVHLEFQPILRKEFPPWEPAPRRAQPAVSALAAPAPQVKPGAALRDKIWDERILPTAYAKLPESAGGWRNTLKALRAFATLRKTFDTNGDELPKSRGGFKLLHPFGSVLKVRYRSAGGHPFTGLLASADVPGLARLSLGAEEKSGSFIPGTGLKLFIDGRPSANAVFLGQDTGVDGQQPDKNFMAQRFTNRLPKARLWKNKIAAFILGLFNWGNALDIPVDHFALHEADGTPVAEPVAAYRLVLEPVPGRATPSVTSRPFQDELAALGPGSLFAVFATLGPGQPLIPVGEIEAESAPVASEYGDKGLFFRHRRGWSIRALAAAALAWLRSLVR